MASKLLRTALFALPLAALSACSSTGSMSLNGKADNFGEANRQTFAAQVINPNPVYDEPYVGGSGDKAAQAIERYRTDKVKAPEKPKLSTIGSAGN
jgi:type IV pilus biogenesis protein CpaD/CtpE